MKSLLSIANKGKLKRSCSKLIEVHNTSTLKILYTLNARCDAFTDAHIEGIVKRRKVEA